MRAQHIGTGDKVVQWHWQWSATSRTNPRKKLLCAWDPWRHCHGLQEEGDSTQVWWERSSRQWMQETKKWRKTWVSGNGSNIGCTRSGTLGSSYPLENSKHASGHWLDSTERRRGSGSEDLQKLGWITSVSGQTDEARHQVHSLHYAQTHECTYQSTLAMRKTTSMISSKFKRFKTYSHKRSKLWFSGGKWCRLFWWCEWQKINDRLLLQAQRTWRSTQLGCQEAGHSCSFFVRSRKSGHDSSSSKSIVSETTSGGFRHPSKTYISNWKGQPELYQIVTKSSHAQEEQTQWDKKITSFGKRRKMRLFQFIAFQQTKWHRTSLRNLCSYWRWKHSELFWWEQTLRNQLMPECGC